MKAIERERDVHFDDMVVIILLAPWDSAPTRPRWSRGSELHGMPGKQRCRRG